MLGGIKTKLNRCKLGLINNKLGSSKRHRHQTASFGKYLRGTKRLVSVNICSVEGNSADIFVNKVSPGILVIKRK